MTAPLTEAEIVTLEATCDAATPGPLEASPNPLIGGAWIHREGERPADVKEHREIADVYRDVDATALAACFNAVPRLIAELRGMSNARNHYKSQLEELHGMVAEMCELADVCPLQPPDAWTLKALLVGLIADLRAAREREESLKNKLANLKKALKYWPLSPHSLQEVATPDAGGTGWEAMPSGTDRENGGQPCDMLVGPCACGATHDGTEGAGGRPADIVVGPIEIVYMLPDAARKVGG